MFVSRIWGGIKHNVRCFEVLNRLPGNNLLLAISTSPARSASTDYEKGKEKEKARVKLEHIGGSPVPINPFHSVIYGGCLRPQR